jgi:putative inorganic carbon (HCO3(-)) transporter
MATGQTPINTYTVQSESRSTSLTPFALLIILAGVLLPGAIAYGFGSTDENQVFAIVLATLGVVAILARPFIGMVFFVALLYIRPEETIPALAGMHFTLAVAVLTLAGMVGKMCMDRQPIVRTPLNGMIICFGLATILSSVNADDIMPTIQDNGRLVILVLLIINLVRTPERYQGLVTALLVFTGYLAVYSIYLFNTGGVVLQDNIHRTKATGIFGDPNDLASTFVAGVALIVMRVVETRGVARFAYLILSGIYLYATYLTNSRGGVLALIGLTVCYLIILKLKPAVKIGCVFLGIALFLASTGRMTNFSSQEESANSRFWFWDNGYQLLIQHPISGVGYGVFPSENGSMTAHNTFVLCYAELGLVGYFFFMGCIYHCYRKRPETDLLEVESAGQNSERPEANTLDRGSLCQNSNIVGARLALTTYLMASFWLSHTYTPILYVLLCLPIVAQPQVLSYTALKLAWKQRRWRDWSWIALLCFGSIAFIEIMAMRLR